MVKLPVIYSIKCAYSKIFGNVTGTFLGHVDCKNEIK